MKQSKKIQKKLEARIAAHSRISEEYQKFGQRYVPEGKFTMPGSRNRRKG